jgi:hypothetical protein
MHKLAVDQRNSPPFIESQGVLQLCYKNPRLACVMSQFSPNYIFITYTC